MAAKAPIVIVAFLVLASSVLGNVPQPDTVRMWAKSIKKDLIEDIGDKQIFVMLNQGFSDESNYQNLHGSEIVKGMANDLADLFVKKVKALKKLRDKAEEAVSNYGYVPNLKMTDVKYYDMKDDDAIEIQASPKHSRFKQRVSFNTSGIYIPADSNEGLNKKMLNELKWSETLDAVFRENWQENTDLAWQFFGNKDFLRVFPASPWKGVPQIPAQDTYDIQGRPWYTQGLASPKDMLILLDVSGSMHGQTLDIMKRSVKAMLNTLEANDYVNVLWFSNRVGYVSCFNKFVQANTRNKKVLFDGLDKLKAANLGNAGKALKFAFEHFRNFSETKQDYEGAECHKLIMFFTDGGTERPDEVFKEHNKDKQFRIFTYAIGPHAIPVHTIKAMACGNRGFFYPISAVAEIRPMVQHYPNVLARPMALADSQAETYSTAYTDAGGLGMVITVTMPVYNRSEESGNQTTAGLVGIDTPIEDIAKAIPKDKTGPNSYVFVITENGFAILHPKMVAQDGHLEDAPDIDFLDLENNDPSQEAYINMLRTDMINGETGSKQYRTYVNTGDQYHIVEKNMTYYFAPIGGTSLSLGIAIPEDRKAFVHAKGSEYAIVDKLEVNTTNEGVLIAPWKFCPEVKDNDKMADIEILSEQLKENRFSICQKDLIRRLAFDIRQTKTMQQFMLAKKNENMFLGKYKSAIFIGTDGGLMRVYPKSQMRNFVNVTDPYTANYFKKALYYAPHITFFTSHEINSHYPGPAVIAVKAAVTSKGHKPAVYGMYLKAPELHELLKKKIGTDGSGCHESDKTVCYLLDDGGYIIASNQEDHHRHRGFFLGDEDPALMWHLSARNDAIFKRRLEYDYNGVCKKMEMRINAAPRSQHAPAIGTLAKAFIHLMMDAILWLTVTGSNMMTTVSGQFTDFAPVGMVSYSCTKVRTLYYPHQMNQEGRMDNCNVNNNCTREFSAVQIQESNLLLVVATAPAACPLQPCQDIIVKHRPEETGGHDTCEMETRFRKRPYSQQACFANNTLEDTSKCIAGVGLPTASPYLAAMTLVAVTTYWKFQ